MFTSSFLVDFAFKFFAFYLNSHVWVLWQTFVTFFVFVFTNAFDLKKTQSPCEQEFCGIVTWLGNVFAFFALLSLEKNSRRRSKKKIALSPCSQEKWFLIATLCFFCGKAKRQRKTILNFLSTQRNDMFFLFSFPPL